MRVTISDVLNAQEMIGFLAQSKNLPVRASFNILKLTKQMQKEMADYNEQRIALCKKYGELDEKKGQYEFLDKKKQEAFEKEFGELLLIELELSCAPIELDDLENVGLSPLDLSKIENFINIL